MARGRSAGYDTAASMNEVAEACGLSKPALYHYFRDKYDLLVHIAEGHVSRLQLLVAEVEQQQLPPEQRLRTLIERFVLEYASAKHAHRVLTEDVKFLKDEDRRRILGSERGMVEHFSSAIGQQWPQVATAGLTTPTAMLLFGMINWMFTWFRPEGELSYEDMAPIVADLFFGGVPAVHWPAERTPSSLSADSSASTKAST
jgi:TetR/AcrR family transcriptional regulator